MGTLIFADLRGFCRCWRPRQQQAAELYFMG